MKHRTFHSVALWLIVLSALAQSSDSASQSQEQPAAGGQPPSSQTLVLPPDASGQPVPPQTLMVPPSAPSPGQPPSVQGLQTPPGPAMTPGQAQGQAPPPPPVAKMYAMRASGAVPQKLDLDEKLKPVASVLESLPFTTYESISVLDQALPWGQETLFPINAVYALRVTPVGLEQDGAIGLQARVEMLQGETFINALKADARAVQNQALLFRGMPMGEGELVLVLLVGMPPEQQKGNNSSEGEPPEPQGEQQDDKESESGQDRSEEGEETPQEGETPEEQTSPQEKSTEGEQEEPEGIENLDALLESLDDIDREEQVKERNQRDRIDFKGDWW